MQGTFFHTNRGDTTGMNKNERAKRKIQKFVSQRKRMQFGNKRQIKAIFKLVKAKTKKQQRGIT